MNNARNLEFNTHFELSIVILCYREGYALEKFTQKAIALLNYNKIRDYQIILVGNYLEGTNDITPVVVNQIASKHPKITAVTLQKKGMMGWDMRSGLNEAKGSFIAIIDGDGQMPFEDIIKVYNRIRISDYDMVKTRRITRGDSLWRKIISIFFNIVFRLLFPGLKARDVNAKPKILKRSALDKLDLTSDDWFIDTEIMIQARRFKFKIDEIPCHFKELERRRSFVGLPTIFEFIYNMIRFRLKEFKYHPK